MFSLDPVPASIVYTAYTFILHNSFLIGNDYRVVGVAVRSASILDRVTATAVPSEATVFLDVTEAVSGATWQATPRVSLIEQDGRWYLARAPLAPA